jgi:guanylate cyclase
MRVQLSEDCKGLLDQIGGYITEKRGVVSVKVSELG